MKLVTIHSEEKECLINCDNITVVKPNVCTKGTIIFFDSSKYMTVDEDYEEVKREIQE